MMSFEEEEMWLIIVPFIVALTVVYIVHTLITSSGSELEDNSFDAFLDHTISTGTT